MKLVVFAHVPPPHHGQSQMVQYLVDGFRAEPAHGVEVLHVDARLSDDLTDIGSARGGKLGKLLGHVRDARRLGRSTGVSTLYYVPSPPKRNSLYRDWIALGLLRRHFRRVIFHWHAVGLGQWLEQVARPAERAVSHRILGRPAMNIVLSRFNRPDADRFRPLRTEIVPNGVRDACPDFAHSLAEHRCRRLEQRLAHGGEVKLLFLALCSRDKGVLDAVEAVMLANRLGARLPRPLTFRLLVAGTFPNRDDESAFRKLLGDPATAACVRHTGFLDSAAKAEALRDSDAFLFPSFFANEGQPLNLIEAMAFGLPPVSTRWRGIPEMLPADYAGLVEPQRPAAAAEALLAVAQSEDGLRFRQRFLDRFQLDAHLKTLAAALRSVSAGT